MNVRAQHSRRTFLRAAIGTGAVVAFAAPGAQAKGREKEEDVSPTEDLMREHGVLRRILLVYREVIRRIEAKQDVPPDPIARAASVVRGFVEDYHERDEEDYIFPRFEKAGQLTDLVAVLREQHRVGRQLTADIQRLATAAALATGDSRQAMADAMGRFIRMYEPHAAREDTVLFPAFRRLVSEKELHQLMETFEQKEKALVLGDLEQMVAEVTAIEQVLGIYELGQFTVNVNAEAR